MAKLVLRPSLHEDGSGASTVSIATITAIISAMRNNDCQPNCGSIVLTATAASKYPSEYPACMIPEKRPRQRLGEFSITNEAPIPQYPPMPIP